ncbi:hypothetical protein BBO99_00009652 [Phytophthora kernoviae]|uniref:Trichohyalin-plectin-homology domain-containing protein n=2 Tax=Phytophthora kernoviae TaxID=325452 RepID=A0A3R7K8Y9_9STRA|nr:hypothetical protein G195_010977 [Phytophthora kernoviae 00238/432]KAG2503608.1 hypothetical protein JM18_009238 [Phytophthora kernoviae]RLN37148.1 hypothetical protein BBI17_009688 [Phytophthora kernoviae]RLN72924.1 hypothetical protein BBO99_00009652 [Phytophthora kernoviae]
MVATGGGVVLTPAQRNLVEKSRAVKQQRAAALAAQHHVEASARAHVQEVKIFEQELAEVQQAKDEAECKRLAGAAEYRIQLAQQEAEKRSKRLGEQAVDDAYARVQAVQQAEWKEQEKVKQQRKHEQVALEAQRWQQDLRAQTEALRVAQEKKQCNERRTLERFQLQDEDDKRRKAERKAADIAEVARVKQANSQQLELKRQAMLRDQQEDLELQKTYEKKLAMQEAARQAELDAILAKQSHKVKLALLNVKSAEEKAHEDELRALAVQAAVRARDLELLGQKECRKREAARVQIQALAMQKEEKKSRMRELEQEETVYASEFKADHHKWQQEQAVTRERVHYRNRDYQKLVRQQMSDDAIRRADEDKYGMTLLEAQLNIKLLQKAGVASPPKDIHIR